VRIRDGVREIRRRQPTGHAAHLVRWVRLHVAASMSCA
jgi:hypothetical protein